MLNLIHRDGVWLWWWRWARWCAVGMLAVWLLFCCALKYTAITLVTFCLGPWPSSCSRQRALVLAGPTARLWLTWRSFPD